ncbi:hypothetical protein Q7P37_005642 [Cladosporium fusiforme]
MIVESLPCLGQGNPIRNHIPNLTLTLLKPRRNFYHLANSIPRNDDDAVSITSKHGLIIKIDAAGSPRRWNRRGNPSGFPHIGGHEFTGTIIARSNEPSVAAAQYPLGSRVGVPGRGFGACGPCFECKYPANELPVYSPFCQTGESNGISKDGGFAEYALVDARECVLSPEGLQAVDATPLMCAGVTIYNAIKRCNLSLGQRLGIIGYGGGLGNLGLQFADAMGLRVTGVDAAEGQPQLARSLKTKALILDARSSPVEEVVSEIGKEDGKPDKFDMGLDAVLLQPESQRSFDYGDKLLRNHSLCVWSAFLWMASTCQPGILFFEISESMGLS